MPLLDTRMKPGLPWLKRYMKQASISRERGVRLPGPIIQALSNTIARRTISSSSRTVTPPRIATLASKASEGMEDLNGNGQIDLDEVSKYLYNLDLGNGKSSNKQNIKTYSIGFSITKKLLEDTARNGGGKYFYVHSSQSFDVAFQTFIADVLKESTSYVAPVVPISQMERTSAGNRMYLAMFKPTEKSLWKGNIKKFGLAIENSGLKDKDNSPTGDFPGAGDIDYNCNKMLDSK